MSKFFPDLDADDNPIVKIKSTKTSSQNLDDLIEETVSKSLGLAKPDASGYITHDWTDPKTGLTYKVREKAVQGPQGDFRVSELEANERFKAMMGAPRVTAPKFQPRDHLRKESSLQDSEYFQEQALLKKERLTEMQRVKRQNLMMPHREKFEDASLDIDVPDLPSPEQRPSGAFATQNLRGRHDETISPPVKQNLPQLGPTQSSKVIGQSLVEKALATRDSLQTAQVSAFKGLFGESAANQIVKRTVHDRSKDDSKNVSSRIVNTVIQDGLLASKQATDLSEGPLRQDTLAQHLGTRALVGLQQKNSVEGLKEMPLAQRDLLAIALGRTVLSLSEQAMATKTSAELIELSKYADTSLQRTAVGLNATLDCAEAPKFASDMEGPLKQDTLLSQRVGLVQSSQSRIANGPSDREILRKDGLQDSLQAAKILFVEAFGHLEKPELLEPTKKVDLLVQALLKRPVISTEMVQALVRPDLVAQKAKEELVRRHTVKAEVQVPTERAKTLLTDRGTLKQRDTSQTRPEMPLQEVTPGQKNLLGISQSVSDSRNDRDTQDLLNFQKRRLINDA